MHIFILLIICVNFYLPTIYIFFETASWFLGSSSATGPLLVLMLPVLGGSLTEWWEGFLGMEFILKWSVCLQTTIRLYSAWRLGSKTNAKANRHQSRGGSWNTGPSLPFSVVGDGWDHHTREILLILNFSWIQASLLAAWVAVNGFLWHTALLAKKTSFILPDSPRTQSWFWSLSH